MSVTQAWLSGPAAAAAGLVAFGVVALDAGWRFLRHGTVMAHEGGHAVLGSLLFRDVSGIKLNRDATGGTLMNLEVGAGSSDGANLSQLTLIPRLIWFLLWLAATLAALAFGGKLLVMPA